MLTGQKPSPSRKPGCGSRLPFRLIMSSALASTGQFAACRILPDRVILLPALPVRVCCLLIYISAVSFEPEAAKASLKAIRIVTDDEIFSNSRSATQRQVSDQHGWLRFFDGSERSGMMPTRLRFKLDWHRPDYEVCTTHI